MLQDVRNKVLRSEIEFTNHAVDQSIRRNITVGEIREVILAGVVIEDYPEDKYGPSCLILGYTATG